MIDANKPVTNPELVEIMNKFLIDRSPENELILIERMNKAHFLVPIVLEGEIENGVVKAGTTIGFKHNTNNTNETFLIAFTDWDELGKWSSDTEQTLISTYADLKSLVLKDTARVKGFAINPCGQNLVITPELIKYLAGRKSELVIEKDTKVLLGQPANYPRAMAGALVKFFRKHKEVASAYLFLIHKEGDLKPNLLLVIDFTGEKAVLFPQIAAVAQNYLGPDEYLDLVPKESSFGKDTTKNATPFYRKKTWGLF